MSPMVYFIIFMLFVIYFTWVWNGTKGFGNISLRISFITIGTLCITLITYILFLFSKIGVEYPKKEMISVVRKMILLVFVPVNGFITMPQGINLINRLKDGNISQEEKSKKFRKLLIIILVLIILECIYFKNIQNGIINYINMRQ